MCVVIIFVGARPVINVGSAIGVELGDGVNARNWSCRLGGQMGTSVKALQARAT